MNRKKIVIWDIEATNLNANFGTVLCVGWKHYGKKKVHVPSILDVNGKCDHCKSINEPTNDAALLAEIYDTLADADAWVTWFGKGYDVKFVNTRLLYHGMPPLPPVPHFDGWLTARKKLKMTSNRLNTIQGFFELEDEKTPVTGRHWTLAQAGDAKALKYIIEHCRKDVLVLEQAYEKLMPMLMDGAHLGGDCPRCGACDYQSRGYQRAGTLVYQRFRCNACGGWFRKKGSERDRSEATVKL